MVASRVYDFMYRIGLARMLWSSADRWEIRRLVEGGSCDPANLAPTDGGAPRALELGCGEGGVSVYLAQHGFVTVGLDFSEGALRLARRARDRAGLDRERLRFVHGDFTSASIPGVEGPFDLLVDYGSLDDLTPEGRRKAAALVDSLTRPGTRFFLYAAVGRREELPRLGYPSRYGPFMVPGEAEQLFGERWEVERIPREGYRFIWTYLLTRR